LRERHRSENLQWSNFLAQIATGSVQEIQLWSQVGEQFHVHLTQSTDDALAFVCADLRPQDLFPLDRLWTAPTNQLAGEVNRRLQECRAASARGLGIVKALTQLVTPIKSSPRLDHGHQIDFIERIETPDFSPISFILTKAIHARY
jgi:hypothetical protein